MLSPRHGGARSPRAHVADSGARRDTSDSRGSRACGVLLRGGPGAGARARRRHQSQPTAHPLTYK